MKKNSLLWLGLSFAVPILSGVTAWAYTYWHSTKMDPDLIHDDNNRFSMALGGLADTILINGAVASGCLIGLVLAVFHVWTRGISLANGLALFCNLSIVLFLISKFMTP